MEFRHIMELDEKIETREEIKYSRQLNIILMAIFILKMYL